MNKSFLEEQGLSKETADEIYAEMNDDSGLHLKTMLGNLLKKDFNLKLKSMLQDALTKQQLRK